MALIDLPGRRIHAKIVYYGPELGGKTTNLRQIARTHPAAAAARLRSIAATDGRTIFSDTLPLDLGKLAGIRVSFELFSVAGQDRYEQTRQLVLYGADGVIFVADAQASRLDANRTSLDELAAFAGEQGRPFPDLPLVFQYNKMDLPDALPASRLDDALNPGGLPRIEAVAIEGTGVAETLRAACRAVARAF